MKAFVSAMLVATLLLPLLVFLSSRADVHADEGQMLSRAFAAEANRNAGETALLAMKEAMRRTAAERMPRDARSVKETEVEIGKRLADFEAFAENEFATGGKEVDVWCGPFSAAGADALARAMADGRKTRKCDGCWDAGKEISLVGKNGMQEINACAFAIIVQPAVGGGKVGVGNAALSLLYDETGGALVPADEDVAGAIATGEIYVGVSVYDARTGAASVRYIAPGEMEEY
ncbi:Uncharacterised protein [Candidatus Burarchaeum australiense]|nr:Uncharacterised protein [Candidatus Burarchaeum australiense]